MALPASRTICISSSVCVAPEVVCEPIVCFWSLANGRSAFALRSTELITGMNRRGILAKASNRLAGASSSFACVASSITAAKGASNLRSRAGGNRDASCPSCPPRRTIY